MAASATVMEARLGGIALALIGCAWLGSCSAVVDPDELPPRPMTCVEGMLSVCPCVVDGTESVQRCNAQTGSFDPCLCDAITCAPGQTATCTCSDGSTSTQECTTLRRFRPCECGSRGPGGKAGDSSGPGSGG